MTDATLLINRRGMLKGQITRILNYTQETKESIEITQVKARKDRLIEIFASFDEIQTAIEEITGITEEGEKYRGEVEELYFKTLSNCEKLIKEEYPTENCSNVRSGGDYVFNNSATGSNHVPSFNTSFAPAVKLAALKIPKFTGTYAEWSAFNDIFTALVHNNETLSEIQKFFYLRSSLGGEAEKSLQCLETSAENYRIAWQTLTSRYNNKKVLIQNHTRALYDLTPVTTDSSAQVRQLIDTVNGHINALQMLGAQPKSWGALLIHLITIKLDKESLREWETTSSKTEISTVEKLLEFLQNRFLILEAIESSNGRNAKTIETGSSTAKKWPNKSSALVTTNEIKCYNCMGAHTIYRCPSFLALPINSRLKKVNDLKLCKNCLRSHIGTKCQSRRCSICSRPHNSLLHYTKKTDNGEKNDTKDKSSGDNNDPADTNIGQCPTVSINAHASRGDTTASVLLATAIVRVCNENNESVMCRVLLDSGSQNNFMTEEICQSLKLRRTKISCSITGIGQSSQKSSCAANAIIKSLISNYKITLGFLVLPKLTNNIPLLRIDQSKINVPKNIKLADPQYYKPQKIDIILGASVFFELLGKGRFQPVKNNVHFIETRLGYVISGQVSNTAKNLDRSTQSFIACADENNMHNLEEKISRFWQSEEIMPEKTYTLEEKLCQQYFDKTVKRDEDGRFIVSLPFRETVINLGESKDIALRRFLALERRLNTNIQLKNNYTKFIEEYINLGHMSLVDTYHNTKHYFLPHHAVFKEDSTTTKLRVVFDGTCRTTSNLSLNDVLLKGPVIQEELVTLLARFRTHKYALTADIKQMYRQIQIENSHRDYQLILWRPDENQSIKTYRLNTVTYGTVPASFLATGCLHKIAEHECTTYPHAAEIIKNDFYMDDLLTGSNTVADVKRLRNDVITILRKGGFELRKWAASDPILLADMRESENRDENLILELDNGPTKILGLIWNPSQDVLQYKVLPYDKSTVVCKRKILSDIASIYDPLGLIGPVLTQAKLFLRMLFCAKYEWDSVLPAEIEQQWITYRTNLHALSNVTIPRSIISDDDIVEIQVHGFSDASVEAYGACMYLRITYTTGRNEVRLVASKSRVAPLKSLSLPRLELCAAVLLCRLMSKITKKLKLNVIRRYFWTDSTIVLAWISSSSTQWGVFVAHRVGEIQDQTAVHEWRHVNSANNPADVISRGRDPSLIQSESIWWEGPTWLKENAESWPKMYELNSKIVIPEARKTITISTNCVSIINTDISFIDRYSSLIRLLRVIAYCIRFFRNLQNTKNKSTGPLQTDEIIQTAHCIVRVVQGHYWAKEISELKANNQVSSKSKIFRLRPFLDNELVIRVGGRLKNANTLDLFQRQPALLPSSSSFTKLIFRDAHTKLMHGGPAAMLAYVRERYWPVHGRNTARKIFYECVKCFRTKPVTMQPIMGDLPKQRVEPSRPFAICGIDFAGPFSIKSSLRRNAPINKGYVCMFVCFTTKAVHIELVCDLSTEAFLNALKRFTNRRGVCSEIFSDNATNFVGANRRLSKLKNLFHKEEHMETIQGALTGAGIRWNFIPPRSPHFGGLWESAIKSMKTHLYRTLGNANMTYEELNTVIIHVEACLNSRPLCPLSSDPSDLVALTPGHFLTGDSLTAVPEPNITTTPINRLNRWRRVTQLSQQLWSRWQKEYLSQLQLRNKWAIDKGPNIANGTVVLVKEDNIPPLHWKLGKVTKVHPGTDGRVRVVTLQTANGQFTRAVRKICPLPFEGNPGKE